MTDDGSRSRIPVASADLGPIERGYLLEAFDSGILSGVGPFVERFETAFAETVGARHAIACANGTASLHLILRALGVGPGDEVIVPDLTYVATANAVTYCGATPVFADVDPDTWCVSASTIAAVASNRTVGVIPVHLYGHPCDMDEIVSYAQGSSLFVIEDAAEALGATVRGRAVGGLGTASSFSFFGNKVLTTGEGGMVCTNDDSLANLMRVLRGQGMSATRRYWFDLIGFNYRMPNLCAAIGYAQLSRRHELITKRRSLATCYTEALRMLPAVQLPVERPWAQHAYWMYSVWIRDCELPRRDQIMQLLTEEGIETRPLFYPMSSLPLYPSSPKTQTRNAVEAAKGGISLPSGSHVGPEGVQRIARSLRDAIERTRT